MKRLVIASNIIFTLIGIASILLALTSVMLFDAPGSENNTYLWITFWSAVALPFTCFGSVIASWYIFFKSANYKKAFLVSLLPCLVIAVLCGSLVMIEIYCQGNFVCG